MSVWLVRAGKNGEREEESIQNNITAIGWLELPDVSKIESRDELKSLMERIYPDRPYNTLL